MVFRKKVKGGGHIESLSLGDGGGGGEGGFKPFAHYVMYLVERIILRGSAKDGTLNYELEDVKAVISINLK